MPLNMFAVATVTMVPSYKERVKNNLLFQIQISRAIFVWIVTNFEWIERFCSFSKIIYVKVPNMGLGVQRGI